MEARIQFWKDDEGIRNTPGMKRNQHSTPNGIPNMPGEKQPATVVTQGESPRLFLPKIKIGEQHLTSAHDAPKTGSAFWYVLLTQSSRMKPTVGIIFPILSIVKVKVADFTQPRKGHASELCATEFT